MSDETRILVPDRADFGLCEQIQDIFAKYVLEDGQFTVSRNEAASIYREIVNVAWRNGLHGRS